MNVYRGVGESALAEVAIFDPDDRDCVVAIQIKSEHPYGPGWDARVAGTVFLFGNPDLARGLHRLFAKRLDVIPPMTEGEVRALAAGHGQEPDG